MTKLIMTLSGTRGLIGDNLTPEIALSIGRAFASTLVEASSNTDKKQPTIIVGGDTRTSHDMVKSAVIAGITSVGANVIEIGKVTTPTVQQMIRHYNADGGCVVTASHNPIEWNGIKLMNNTGSFVDDEHYSQFDAYYTNKKQLPLANWETVGNVTTDHAALEKHVDIILDAIDVSSIQESNLNILIDPNNGTGCLANPILLDKLNINYTQINKEGNGKFSHRPEPLKENVTQISDVLKNGDYDIGFVQDPDADRLVILDENGRFIGEDYSLAFCVDYVLAKEEADNKRVVVNLSTSNILEWVANKHKAAITYTKIGESNVTQAIKELKATVGGEGNGGVIFPRVGWGRDSLTGIVLALKHLAEKKQSVSQIVSEYPQYTMVREKFSVSNRDEVDAFLEKVKEKYNDREQNTQDGVKVLLDDAWVHVRPSNTEPILRIFIEAPSQQQANQILDEVLPLKSN